MGLKRIIFVGLLVSAVSVTGCTSARLGAVPQTPTPWTGLGVVVGLSGRGDGATFTPLVRVLESSIELREIDPKDAALATITATERSHDGTMSVFVSAIGPCTDLSHGVLAPAPLTAGFPPNTGDRLFVAGNLQINPSNTSVASTKAVPFRKEGGTASIR